MINKLKRTLTSLMPVEDGRIGSCNNCGACCRLPFRCMFSKTTTDENNEQKEYCSIYTVRPPNCRKFPRSAEEYSLVKDTCGFDFNEASQTSNSKKYIRIFPKS